MSSLADLEATGLVSSGVILGSLTTYKLGGPARFYAEPGSVDELRRVLAARRDDGTTMLILGRGSNLVIADAGFDGLVVRLGKSFGSIHHLTDRIVAGGAVSLPMLARSAVGEGRLGLEFFVGIPGSVGGAVRQNAGCHGVETRDVLASVEVVGADGVVTRRDLDHLDMAYRHSNIAADEVVTSAEFSFKPGEAGEGERVMRDVIRWRKAHQPGGTLNAGSVFKNPPGDAAGRIIDSLGLKGLAVGGASVSTRHANFFVATSEATASDVFRLVSAVREIVEREAGVSLEPEICFAGFEERT
jgi:UDP-N-acetylmuramate dehydrogenase